MLLFEGSLSGGMGDGGCGLLLFWVGVLSGLLLLLFWVGVLSGLLLLLFGVLAAGTVGAGAPDMGVMSMSVWSPNRES